MESFGKLQLWISAGALLSRAVQRLLKLHNYLFQTLLKVYNNLD